MRLSGKCEAELDYRIGRKMPESFESKELTVIALSILYNWKEAHLATALFGTRSMAHDDNTKQLIDKMTKFYCMYGSFAIRPY